MNRIIDHGLHFNSSFTAMENLSKIANSTPNASVYVPETKFKIKKLIKPIYKFETHIKCNGCLNYTASFQSETQCPTCNIKIKTSLSDYFMNIPIEQQIRRSLKNHISEILEYNSKISSQSEMMDIHNAEMFKNIQKKYPFSVILPLIVNTDGVKVFNSNQKSLWMIQSYQGYLPPSIRFMPSNVLINAAHFGSKKPGMRDFFFPFLNELCDIHKRGGINMKHNGADYNFMPLIISCCCDLPAKCDVQGMIGHSGYFACSYCYHPGFKNAEKKKSMIRYSKSNEKFEMRTHRDVIYTYGKMKSEPIRGIKSMSCMIAAKEFDLILSFAIDYMHLILLGIMRKLFDLWLDTKNHKEDYYISKKNQIALSHRLINIKPVSEILRKPRSIFARKDFKANEYRSLLLYYLRFALVGLLGTKYRKHFEILSTCIYALSKEKISFETIEQTDKQLNYFADTFEDLYGKSNVTLNLHLIRHLAKMVWYLGPLWSQSAFAFEANNGVVTKANTSNDKIVHQLVWKYVMKHTVETTDKKAEFSLGRKGVIMLTSVEIDSFSEIGVAVKCNRLPIHKNISIRGVKFTSKQMKEVSTIDYFVKLKSEIFGAINFYTVLNSNLYVSINVYEIIDVYDHFFHIKDTGIQKVFEIKEIETKMLYMKFGQNEYVTSIPNRFEKT